MLKTFFWSNILVMIAPTLVFGIQARRFPEVALEIQLVAMTLFLAVNFFAIGRSLRPQWGVVTTLLLAAVLSLPLAWFAVQDSLIAIILWVAVLAVCITGTRKRERLNA